MAGVCFGMCPCDARGQVYPLTKREPGTQQEGPKRKRDIDYALYLLAQIYNLTPAALKNTIRDVKTQLGHCSDTFSNMPAITVTKQMTRPRCESILVVQHLPFRQTVSTPDVAHTSKPLCRRDIDDIRHALRLLTQVENLSPPFMKPSIQAAKKQLVECKKSYSKQLCQDAARQQLPYRKVASAPGMGFVFIHDPNGKTPGRGYKLS